MSVSAGIGTALRPAVHFTAPDGWLNDPLGVTWRDGRYELFYQALPGADAWNPRCRWGHATSPDLLTWTHHPIALEPGDDELGCWSGGLTLPDPASARSARIYYTSVDEPDLNLGAVRVARPADDAWERWDKGPVVVTPPPGEDLRVFRDPVVRRDGDRWRMLVGAGYRDGTPAVLTFVSADLECWTSDGVLASTRTAPTGPLPPGQAWECPQLLQVDDRDVLVVSTWRNNATHDVLAAVGVVEDGRMRVERWQRLTHGTGHYAATGFIDADGHPCLLFWLREVADPDGAWTGALSLPYRLSLDHTLAGPLRLTPHPVVPPPGTDDPDGGVRHLVLAQGDAVRLAPAGHLPWSAAVRYEHGTVTVTSDGASTVTADAPGPVHVFVDGPAVEVCTGTALVGLATAGRRHLSGQ
ncbi:MAG TPA: glycoside hydrolase family 32 protein [Kineosporiaceae bacterium]